MSGSGFGGDFGEGFGGPSGDGSGGGAPLSPGGPAPPRGGGYGAESYGDPFGAGGPIQVVRAVAVAGQVIRVTFTEDPLTRSASGAQDALNPANYLIAVVSGRATAPVPVGVDPNEVAGPAVGVGNGVGASGERAVDVHVDRPLVQGISYQVTVKNVVAARGGVLGSPYAAVFAGVTALAATRLPDRVQDLIDLANPPALGNYLVDDSGDLMPEDPDAGLRKRIFRRLTTAKGAFSWLPDYGLAIPLKGVGTVAKMAALRTDGARQVKLEPDVVAATLTASLDASGVVTVVTRAKSRRGGYLTVGVAVSPDGGTAQVNGG